MSNLRPSPLMAATMFAALVTVLACRSTTSERPSRPLPPGARDSAALTNVDGKSMEEVLATRFPGVSVSRTDGGGLQIRIRGGSNTFYGSNEPLYILDGTPLPDGSGGIVYLSPYDIERIEVLKSPSETAIYGIRGSNGVVRITSKRPGKR